MKIFIDVTTLQNSTQKYGNAIARITLTVTKEDLEVISRKFIDIGRIAWNTCGRRAGEEAAKKWLSTSHPMPESEKDEYVFVTSYEKALYEVNAKVRQYTVRRIAFRHDCIPTIVYVRNCSSTLKALGLYFYTGKDDAGTVLDWDYTQVMYISEIEDLVSNGQKLLKDLDIQN